MKSLNDYQIIGTIGKGAFGTVLKAIKLSNGNIVALKTVRFLSSGDDLYLIDQESKFLQKVQDECKSMFVVCYHDSFYDKSKGIYVIEMEYVDGEDLKSYIARYNKSDQYYLNNLVGIARDVSVGLQYIHSNGIIHNDIKLDNIRIQKGTNIPKILDFGVGCITNIIYNRGPACSKIGGTPKYIAPESLIKAGLKLPASDMWSLGVVLYRAAFGEYPFDSYTNNLEDLYEKIINNPVPIRRSGNDTIDRMIYGLLEKDPSLRLTPEGIIARAGFDLEDDSSSSQSGGSDELTASRSIRPSKYYSPIPKRMLAHSKTTLSGTVPLVLSQEKVLSGTEPLVLSQEKVGTAPLVLSQGKELSGTAPLVLSQLLL